MSASAHSGSTPDYFVPAPSLHLRQVDWNQPYGTITDHCNQTRDHEKADSRHTLLALPHVHPPLIARIHKPSPD